MQIIQTEASTHSSGHYAPAVIHRGIAYISGQLPVDYAGKTMQPCGGIEEQTQKALNNLAVVLDSCGAKKENVLKTTVYIADIAAWPTVNKVYGDFFGEHKPARTIVPTGELHFGALVEIEAIAFIE